MTEIGLEQVAQSLVAVGSKVAALGERVGTLQGELAFFGAQKEVLMCAVGALAVTHQDPESFAGAFRECWKLSGLSLSSFPDGSRAKAGFDETLSMLEVLTAVRLSVRPPDQAQPPIQEGVD